MKIKLLCMANGDYYDDIEVCGNAEEFLESKFISIKYRNKIININTEYILSYE